MMMTKETEMKYIGKILNNGQHYEAISDEANDIINIFYKNIKNGDIECWSLQKAKIQQARGKDILAKTKNYWSELSKYSTEKLESMVFLQTFPWDFWADVVVPIKNGRQSDLRCEFQVGEESKEDNEKPTNFRLYLDITSEGENSKIVTQDIFTSIDSAQKAVYSVYEDISKEHENATHGGLLTFEPKTQKDGITYVGQMSGSFTGGKFFIRIITTESEPDEETITAQEIQGRYMELIVDGLGEFKFLFKENEPDDESQGKYIMEVLWNPPNYGIVDFIVGCYIDDIDSTMESIKENMIYYIEGARVSCESHIENGSDDEGVYEEILNSFFGEEYEEEAVNE